MISERETKQYIKRIAEKDIRAQEELFTKTYKTFYQAAVCIVKIHEDAEDIVGEFFKDIYRLSLKCVNVINCKAYLFATVKNLARTFLNNKTKLRAVDLSCAAELIAQENKFFNNETISVFDSVLTENEKKAIILIIYYEYTFRECSKIMRLSLGKIQRLYRSALKKLKVEFNC